LEGRFVSESEPSYGVLDENKANGNTPVAADDWGKNMAAVDRNHCESTLSLQGLSVVLLRALQLGFTDPLRGLDLGTNRQGAI